MKSTDDSSLLNDLRVAINRNSAENGSNTPDYVLSKFLYQTLEAFDYAVRTRDQHRGVGEASAELVRAAIAWREARADYTLPGGVYVKMCLALAAAVDRLVVMPMTTVTQDVTYDPSIATARCTSCDHEIGMHFDPEGCRYTVETGQAGRDLVCPCSVRPPEAEIIEYRQSAVQWVKEILAAFNGLEQPICLPDQRALADYLVDALRLRERDLEHAAEVRVYKARLSEAVGRMYALRGHVDAAARDARYSSAPLTRIDIATRLAEILKAGEEV